MQVPISTFKHVVLSILLYLVFLRASGIGYGFPTEESRLGTISYLPQQLMQALVMLGIMAYLFFIPSDIKAFRVQSLLLKIVFFLSLLSIVFSNYFSLSLRYLLSVIVISAPVILYHMVYGPEKLFQQFVRFVVFILIISIVYNVVFPQYAIMASNHDGSYRGVFLHKNGFGFFSVIASIVLLGCSFRASKIKEKLFFYSLLFLSVGCAVLSQSTTSLVNLLLAVGTFTVLLRILSVPDLSLRVLVLSILLLVFASSVVMLSVYLEDILFLLGKDMTLTGRTDLWETLFFVNLEKPILGYGFGTFYRPEIMHQYSFEFGWMAKSTHNSYLALSLGIGFPSALIFIVYLVKTLMSRVIQRIVYIDKIRVAVSLSIMIICLLQGFSESGGFMASGFSWLVLLVSMLSSFRIEVEAE